MQEDAFMFSQPESIFCETTFPLLHPQVFYVMFLTMKLFKKYGLW